MERYRIVGGASLRGDARVRGAKNSALKLMAAALLAEGTTVLHDVPSISDVAYMSDLLGRLGATVRRDGATLEVDVPSSVAHEAPYDLVRKLRASICVLGPLLARCGEVDVALPGGDAIGSRGLNMHIDGLSKLGADVSVEHGYIVARAPHGLMGANIWLDFPSVGATENIVTAAVLAKGATVIDNAAREPEVADLCTMLTEMGAEIEGIGTSTLVVEGVDSLAPVEHTTVPDRIVAGTWAIGAVMTRGDVVIQNARAADMEIVLDKLVAAGAVVESGQAWVRVAMSGRPGAVDVVTLPYPGFPTDLQPMIIALNSVADGTAMVTENVYEARFMFVNELARLGADVRTDGHHAVVRGREKLSGAPVVATDIRAGAGLVLAGLVAEGETVVSAVQHIDRGYPDLVGEMGALGAEVVREPDPERVEG